MIRVFIFFYWVCVFVLVLSLCPALCAALSSLYIFVHVIEVLLTPEGSLCEGSY